MFFSTMSTTASSILQIQIKYRVLPTVQFALPSSFDVVYRTWLTAVTDIFGTEWSYLYFIPLAYLALCLSSSLVSIVVKWLSGNFTNSMHHLSKEECKGSILQLAWRADCAQRNGFEALHLFNGTILCAAITKLDPATVHAYAWTFILLRLIYTVTYILQIGPLAVAEVISVLRSSVWALSLGILFTLFELAANKHINM